MRPGGGGGRFNRGIGSCDGPFHTGEELVAFYVAHPLGASTGGEESRGQLGSLDGAAGRGGSTSGSHTLFVSHLFLFMLGLLHVFVSF